MAAPGPPAAVPPAPGSPAPGLFDSVVLRRAAGPLAVASILGGVLIAALYFYDVDHQLRLIVQKAESLLDSQSELLLVEAGHVVSDLMFLAGQRQLAEFLSGNREIREAIEQEYQHASQQKKIYDQIRCLGAEGRELIRVNLVDDRAVIVSNDQLQSKSGRYYYSAAWDVGVGRVFVSPLDLNVEHGVVETPFKPVIRFLTPVVDREGQQQGLLALNYLGARLLEHLRANAAQFAGQAFVVNAEGQYLLGPTPDVEFAWQRDVQASFGRDFPDVWATLQQSEDKTYVRAGSLWAIRRISLNPRSSSSTPRQLSDLYLVAHASRDALASPSRTLLAKLAVVGLASLTALGAITLFWARASLVRRAAERKIAESETRLRLLSRQLLSAQEQERRSISRDLHDELGQQATAASLYLKSLARTVDPKSVEEFRDRAIQQVDQLLRSLHEVVQRLRPRVLDELALQDALETLISDVEQQSGLHVDAEFNLTRSRVPPEIGENIYRIVQEALGNAAAHSQADCAEVFVESDEASIRLVVSDCGVGFDPERAADPNRLGLLGMRERVELLNGSFSLATRPGAGVRIEIQIPLASTT
ncbi:MAG: ATP-binding protein [Planctomycetales bacterium]|nr:ATP-binding protein [Planctomycetales bacterium]